MATPPNSNTTGELNIWSSGPPDASGHTERLFGHSDWIPFALAPQSQGEADERRPARAALI